MQVAAEAEPVAVVMVKRGMAMAVTAEWEMNLLKRVVGKRIFPPRWESGLSDLESAMRMPPCVGKVKRCGADNLSNILSVSGKEIKGS